MNEEYKQKKNELINTEKKLQTKKNKRNLRRPINFETIVRHIFILS